MESPEIKRLKIVYESLKKKRIVNSMADFEKKVDTGTGTISKSIKRNSITIGVIEKICKVFNLSEEFIINGNGPIYSKQENEKDGELMKKISLLENDISEIKGIINLLMREQQSLQAFIHKGKEKPYTKSFGFSKKE